MKNKITSIVAFVFTLLLMSFNQVSFAQTYCIPSASNSNYYIDEFSTTNGVANITNSGTGFSANGYGDYTSQVVSAIQGDSVDFFADFSSWSNWGAKIWVDWNQDGDFDDAGEEVYTTTSYVYSASGTIAVPPTATPGNTRLRIRISYTPSSGPDACSTTASNYGEAEDYTFQVIPLAPPDNAGIDSLVSPAMNGAFCSGDQVVKVRLRNLGNNTLNSVNINWSINGVTQTPVAYSSPVDSIASPNNFAIIALGTVHFPYNTPVTLKSWTSMPNGVADNDNSDDTLTAVVTSSTQGVIVNITPQDTSFCAGNQLLLDAGQQPAGAIYVWSTGALSQMISVTQGGVYSVKVQSLGGCTDVDTVTITELPQPQAGNLAIVDNGDNSFSFTIAGAQHIDNYSWDFGDGTTASGAGPQTHTYTQPGLYTVVVWLSNACDTIVLTGEVQVLPLPPSGISEAQLQQAIRLYPNPAGSEVTVSSAGPLVQSVSVYNLVGQVIYTQKHINASKSVLNIHALANGIYQIVIHTDKGQLVKKLEVMR